MHVILGATGHIGSAVANLLLDQGEPVTIVVHSDERGRDLMARGAERVVVDIHDTPNLHAALSRGERLFLLNPPAPPSSNTDEEERRTARSIAKALAGLHPVKVVAQSTYGAQAGEGIGDLGTLYTFEEGVRHAVPAATIVRGAYYMSNWDASLETARDEGVVHSFFPIDFELPMAAPQDLGTVAARELKMPTLPAGVHHVEGPARYTAADVANVLARLLERKVKAVEVPPTERHAFLRKLGFSDAAARSFRNMTDVTQKVRFPDLSTVERGATTLEQYLGALVKRAPQPKS